jgi:hypothetical protein
MGISQAELRAQRTITEEFIRADSLEVTLLRSTFTPDGAGGEVKGDPAPLPVQTMRLIPASDGAQERFTADGEAVRPSYMLMGKFDADMERWDELIVDGIRYQIVFVNQNRQYQTKGEVVYRG